MKMDYENFLKNLTSEDINLFKKISEWIDENYKRIKNTNFLIDEKSFDQIDGGFEVANQCAVFDNNVDHIKYLEKIFKNDLGIFEKINTNTLKLNKDNFKLFKRLLIKKIEQQPLGIDNVYKEIIPISDIQIKVVNGYISFLFSKDEKPVKIAKYGTNQYKLLLALSRIDYGVEIPLQNIFKENISVNQLLLTTKNTCREIQRKLKEIKKSGLITFNINTATRKISLNINK